MNRLKNLFSKNYLKKYEQKIKYLGIKNKISIDGFLLSRLFIEIILFIVFLFVPTYGIIISVVSVLLFHIIFTYLLLDSKIKIRNNLLYDEAIIFYNMLKITINETHDLKTSLEIVSMKLDNSITAELKVLLANNKYNNDINSVLNNVINTIPNSDVRTTLLDLKESESYYKTIDNNIKLLQDKNTYITRQNYQFKPLLLTFLALLLLFAIVAIIFNIYGIYDYIAKFFN